MRTVTVADLFCGAGGTSTGAVEALGALGHRVDLTAVNHWEVAVATHAANHPEARHLCASLDSLNPRDLFAGRKLDFLWASPECTHHSRARGGAPIRDQSRATAWCVTRWAEALRPEVIMVENVPEFAEWGPLGHDGKPLASRKGEVFRAWCSTLEAIGYRVAHRVLCAADYGDPTTRRRLFVQAVRGKRRICWPEPTHGPGGGRGELFSLKPWVPARAIIDWSIPGESIFTRKRPLSPKTLARIEAGLRRFGLAPSLITMEHGGSVRSVDRPIPTVTCARGGAMGVAEPYLVHTAHGGERRPLTTAAPLPTVAGNRGDLALVEPCLLPQHGGGILRPVSQPAPTVATAGAVGLVEPFLVEYYGNGRATSVRDPLGTATTKQRFGLAQPEVVLDGQRYLLDVRFRMLQPHELAAAQGFRRDYRFEGTKSDAVKQIGNAVPRRLARALVAAAWSQDPDIARLEDPAA